MCLKTRAFLGGIGVVAALGVSALAGSATYDFNTDPGLNFVGNAEWRTAGGVSDSGYVALFDAVNSQYAGVMIPDFDAGLIVKAFTFECELRVGNAVGNSGRPADGFSVNYARATDPVVADLDQDPPVVNWGNYSIPSAPEGGTTTGLSICFDTWSGNTWPSGETDIEGIILRVDNVTKARVPMTTRNGACNDPTSLQTGPWDETTSGSPDGLCWAPLKVQLAENGEVTVTWKGTVIVDKAQSGFLPSAGRLVFAGRTGGANENTHLDNLKITTVPADKALVTGVSADALGVTVTLDDSGQSVVDQNTVTMTVDGAAATPLTFSKVNKTTTARWNSPVYQPSGKELSVTASFKDTQNVQITSTRTTTVAPYAMIPASYMVPTASVDTSKKGFLMRPYQTEAAQPNTLIWTEEQLLGLHGANTADLTGATGGLYTRATFLNFNIDAPNAVGNFTSANGYEDEEFPGFPGSTGLDGSSTEEVLTYIEFPAAGLYQLGVNSDDGFRVTAGRAPGDLLGVILGFFDGGRGALDTVFSVLIDQPGIYPVRLIWENGSGELPGNGANLEFFSVKDGVKTLINDTTAGALKAYRESTADGPYVSNLKPLRGATGVAADTAIMAEISNGSVQVNAASVKAKLNGVDTPSTAAVAGAKTTVTVKPAGLLASASTQTVRIEFSDNSAPPVAYAAEWSFTVGAYRAISRDLWTAPGTGDATKPGLQARIWQVDQPGSNALANRTHRAEQELAGIIGPNVADLSSATAGVFNIDLVNWNQDATGVGSFPNDETLIPGIPGTGSKPDDSIAGEVITYIEFPAAGYYSMGVNSDDGFKVTVADTPPANNLALVVTGAASAAGSYHAVSGPAGTSKPFTAPVSGKLVYMDPANGCTALVNAEALRGNIALVDRGTCQFSAKIKAAKDAGAIAVVVANNRDINNAEGIYPTEMGVGDVGYQDLPAVMISMPDGDKIKTGLAGGLTVSLTPDSTPALGEFDGGRGAADTIFSFVLPKAGVYPFRCVWYEGGGGANLEWFTVTPDGQKILLNDRANAAGLKTFRARTAQPQPSLRDYGIGLNFGADEANGNKAGTLAATAEAGVPSVAQANWNNLSLLNGTSTTVVADADGFAESTTATVSWTSANTWASTGRGEENNKFTGADKTLMTGYLDTGAATTTSVTIQNLPAELTSEGYDVYVYLLGGVAAKGGGYRIVDATSGAVLKDYVKAQCSVNPTAYVQAVPAGATPGTGTYVLFSGLASPSIKVEASTAGGLGFGSNPRAPINAIQLVAPPSSTPPPALSLRMEGANVVVTFTGTLQVAPSVTGPWSDTLAASPLTEPASDGAKYYRAMK